VTIAPNQADFFYTSFDDLRLYARHYVAATPARSGGRRARPLVCLSSLAGNADEFHDLASFLASHPETPRDVFCLDYRGRGRSARDRNPDNYNPYIELRDILDFLAARDLPRFDVLGSSRGGINLMLLATVRPAALGSLILNDLGPVLEPEGVARVDGYLANLQRPADWRAARVLMRDMYAGSFTALTDDDYDSLARRWFVDRSATASGYMSAGSATASGQASPRSSSEAVAQHKTPRSSSEAVAQHKTPRTFSEAIAHHKTLRLDFSYDERVAYANRHLDLRRTMPDMWGQYLALLRRPLLIIRGERSDMLSRKTLEHMRTVHWRARAVTVPGQGHAPLLRDAASLKTIHAFLAEND
jgi:pimeloyl-ACP methyl ester carboxylesterase